MKNEEEEEEMTIARVAREWNLYSERIKRAWKKRSGKINEHPPKGVFVKLLESIERSDTSRLLLCDLK